MKILKKMIFSTIFMLAVSLIVVLSLGANAIAFIPPVIYFASISLVSFVTNLFLILAVWFAVKGISNRSYFGMPVHKIVSSLMDWAGITIIIICASLAPLLILRPIITKDILVSSFVAGIMCGILLFLSQYRQLRITGKEEKIKSVRSIILTCAVVIIITFISASYSLETKVLRTNAQKGTEQIEKIQSSLSIPNQALNKAREAVAPASPIAADNGYAKAIEPQKQADTLWFYPLNSDACSIYFNENLLIAKNPEKNCYYITSDKIKKKLECPIPVSIDIFIKLHDIGAKGIISGRGSCTQSYSVTLNSNGFEQE